MTCPWDAGRVDREHPLPIQGRNRFWHWQIRLPSHGSQPGQFQINSLLLLVARFVHPQQVLILLKQTIGRFRAWQVGGLNAKQGIPGLADKMNARLVNSIKQQGC